MRVIPVIKVPRAILERLEKARAGLVQKKVWVKDGTGRKGHYRMQWVSPDNDAAGVGRGQMDLFSEPAPKSESKPEAPAGFQVGKKYRHKKDGWEGHYVGPDTMDATDGRDEKGNLKHKLIDAHRINVTKPAAAKYAPMGTTGEWTGQFKHEDFEEVADEYKPRWPDKGEFAGNGLGQNGREYEGYHKDGSTRFYDTETGREIGEDGEYLDEKKPASKPASKADKLSDFMPIKNGGTFEHEGKTYTIKVKSFHKTDYIHVMRDDGTLEGIVTFGRGKMGGAYFPTPTLQKVKAHFFRSAKPEPKPASPASEAKPEAELPAGDSLFGDLPQQDKPKEAKGPETAPDYAIVKTGLVFDYKGERKTIKLRTSAGGNRWIEVYGEKDRPGSPAYSVSWGKTSQLPSVGELKTYFKNSDEEPSPFGDLGAAKPEEDPVEAIKGELSALKNGQLPNGDNLRKHGFPAPHVEHGAMGVSDISRALTILGYSDSEKRAISKRLDGGGATMGDLRDAVVAHDKEKADKALSKKSSAETLAAARRMAAEHADIADALRRFDDHDRALRQAKADRSEGIKGRENDSQRSMLGGLSRNNIRLQAARARVGNHESGKTEAMEEITRLIRQKGGMRKSVLESFRDGLAKAFGTR